jgi:hypothetical protein
VDTALEEFVREPGPLFDLAPMPADALSDALAAADTDGPIFGLVLPGSGYLVRGDPAGVAERMRRGRLSTAVQRLELSVLHAAILEDRLGIDADAIGRGRTLSYTRSPAAAFEAVSRGEADAAFLVRPTRIDQLAAVANAGDVMPQKSTYFHPKLLSGMVFNPLFEAED